MCVGVGGGGGAGGGGGGYSDQPGGRPSLDTFLCLCTP